MQTFQDILIKLAEYPLLKMGIIMGLALADFLIGGVYQDSIIAVMMLMLFDTATGLYASRVVEKQAITSKRFINKVRQCVMYLVAISAANFVDQTIPGQLIQFGTIAFVGGTEFISIMENIGRMGYKTPKKLLEALKDKYESRS